MATAGLAAFSISSAAIKQTRIPELIFPALAVTTVEAVQSAPALAAAVAVAAISGGAFAGWSYFWSSTYMATMDRLPKMSSTLAATYPRTIKWASTKLAGSKTVSDESGIANAPSLLERVAETPPGRATGWLGRHLAKGLVASVIGTGPQIVTKHLNDTNADVRQIRKSYAGAGGVLQGTVYGVAGGIVVARHNPEDIQKIHDQVFNVKNLGVCVGGLLLAKGLKVGVKRTKNKIVGRQENQLAQGQIEPSTNTLPDT